MSAELSEELPRRHAAPDRVLAVRLASEALWPLLLLSLEDEPPAGTKNKPT